MTDREDDGVKYVSVLRAAELLGVQRPTVYYYISLFHLEKKKFPLDRKVYIALSDVAKIRAAREAAEKGER